ncbi:MAG: hypothetical protein AABY91_01350, partial [Gemmatimonadota bacterium]
MTEQSAFDNRPDLELGAQLRAALDTPDGDLFVARLRHNVLAVRQEDSWDVLSRWAPRGLVAAIAAAALLWMVTRPEPVAPAGPMASAPVQMEV